MTIRTLPNAPASIATRHLVCPGNDCTTSLVIAPFLEMTELVNKRQVLVNFTVKDSYKDGKKYINLVSFEWISE